MKEIISVYGQTEASPGCTMSSTDDPIEVRVGTVGRPLPEIECKIINPETGKPVADGEEGEIVITTLVKEGAPLLRFRTHDLSRIIPQKCSCGSCYPRLDIIKGRSDDMIILKGVNIFPIQIETILMQFKELTTNYLITLETKDSNDEMIIEVELEKLFTDDYARLQVLTKNITRLLKDEILVTPHVKLVPKGNLPQSEGKAVRVKDLRKTLILSTFYHVKISKSLWTT